MIEEQDIPGIESEPIKRPVGRPRNPEIPRDLPPESGDSESPQWVKRIQDVSNVGRAKNTEWSDSVLRYIKSYVHKIGWKTQIVCRETLKCMRLIADKYPEVAQVIERWDTYSLKEQTRIFSIDKACIETGADRDEFAGLVLAAVGKHIERNAIAIIDQNFEKIIQAAVDHAITGGKYGAKERVELIKILTRPDRSAKAAPKTETPVGETLPGGRVAQSLDSQLAELDDIENIGVGAEETPPE